MNAIRKACDLVGSQAALAKLLGVTPASVNQWVSGIRPVPTSKCSSIERATGGAVTRRDLRPNDWREIWPELATDIAKDGA